LIVCGEEYERKGIQMEHYSPSVFLDWYIYSHQLVCLDLFQTLTSWIAADSETDDIVELMKRRR